MSDDATRGSAGRLETPTLVATVRDKLGGGALVTDATPVRSVFDPPRVRFDEQAELGRGGMGRVVEAIDLALDRPVAIKHLLASGDEELARFEREVRITARLQHPSIVPILDAGRDAQGMPFYIMRKIDGDPLSARVAAATTARDRIALVPAMLGAIDAAAYAHAQGVIHRDIKPWNILLGPFGETLLIDWGIARDLAAAEVAATSGDGQRDSNLTRVGAAVGTPGFMAPEQARGEAVDRRADVYSLGATLYFVLTGTLPFAGSEATIAISKVAAGAGPDLMTIPPEVPAELTAIVVKALAAERDSRYSDASELATDLRRFLAGQLVAAHRYTTGERLVRWIRRHRIAALVSIVAVVAMTMTAVLAFRSVVAQRDQARAATALAKARAEELLVDRARSMVSTDPTSAVARGGLVSLETDLPIARWSYRGTTLEHAAFSDGLILATSEGRLAYVGALGVFEIPHRRLQLKAIAVTPDGRDLVIAALNGDLMAVDLRAMRPQLVPVPETTTIYGVAGDHLVIGDAKIDETTGSTGVTELAVVELTTGKRRALGSVGFGPFVVVLETLIVASEGPGAPPQTLDVWDLDGRERLRTPFRSHMQVGDGLRATTSVFYGTPDGDLFEQPLEPFGPSVRVRAADGKSISRIQVTPHGVAVAIVELARKPMRTTIEWIGRGDRKVAPVVIDGFAYSFGYGPDGSTWLVQNVEQVVRIAPDGTRAVVPLPQAITSMIIRGPRIWAMGSSALYELSPEGAIVRTVSLPISNVRGQLRDGIVSVADDGLWITMPEANVSRLLPLPGGADQQTSQRDGRRVAAVTRTQPRYVAIWNDPVPVDPNAVPAYLDQLTNARLDLASSAVTWELPSR